MLKFLAKLLDTSQKELNRLWPLVEKINSLEKETVRLTDEQLKAKTAEFRQRLEKENLDGLLVPAFAVCREAIRRTIGERAFDVQLLAAIILSQGNIAEQKTGEGKTLCAPLALYLRALAGRGCHLVTVNDYLARRDSGWYGRALNFLGLKVASIIHEQSLLFDPEFMDESATDERLAHLRPISRKEAYLADVTYGTNNEFGFDYLRDNMVSSLSEMVQGGHHFAIVDEVDSILIDEARTPLIISAPDTEPTNKYYDFARLVEKLSADTDFTVDEKVKVANLTDHGIKKVEKLLGVSNLYEKDFETLHHIENALRAKTLFHRDKDYVVKEDQIIIVDEFTGRLMFGRRWSEGLHQAVEAKEGVVIQQESRTLATISFQNYFRLYEKLAGMTGTAMTEAEEFNKIYKLDVLAIPTNKPMIRRDNADVVYKTQRAKYAAVVREIEDCHKRGQPVLVGTTSIEKNEIIDDFLNHKGVPHQLLNAKYHEKEALIIAQAGMKGAVTVATNMAGRGVDVILGGKPPDRPESISTDKWPETAEYKNWQKVHDEVIRLGGLHVIGTERHESRRIDNQLRGRSGRQGDPGSSRFFVALDDDLMRIFGGEQVSRLMTMFKMPEDIPLEHAMVNRAMEQAQVKVEGFNFDARKHLVEYDDVANKHREIVYNLRKKVLSGESLRGEILEKINQELEGLTQAYSPEGYTEPEYQNIIRGFCEIVPFDDRSQENLKSQIAGRKSADEIKDFLFKIVTDLYESREKQVGPDLAKEIEKFAYLSSIDRLWMDHLDALDDLRDGVGLRGNNDRERLMIYKNDAFNMFETLIKQIDYEIVRRIFRIQAVPQFARPPIPPPARSAPQAGPVGQPAPALEKLGRNDPCWCGSGKKYKKCHYPQVG
ncbi:preprotein translocase subunit SecA [Candidatus Shapirobacteria bacterium]|nr:preprotein translocase subunit SecA [Candidatus Shapirobacteria bacterium]